MSTNYKKEIFILSFIFYFSVFMIFYTYFGYLLSLLIIVKLKKISQLKNPSHNLSKTSSDKKKYCPKVSYIITAYNEENRIKNKIENTLAQNYTKEKLEIIVASDCSSDKTDEIVKSYHRQKIKLVRAPKRKGKENAQKYAIDASSGEILVFSDVATILSSDAISTIVNNFQNQDVGCVSSEDRFIDKNGKTGGEGAYVKYEMYLRKLESKANTIVGLSGSFFAARKKVCENWSCDLPSDFNTLLNSVKLGLKGISDPYSIGYYNNISDEKKEFDRKVRTVLRGISAFMKNLSLLNPFKYGLFSWQLFSHKLCKWLVPFWMITALISNAAIMSSSFLFYLTFTVQIFFYYLAFCYFKSLNTIKTPSPFYTVMKLSYYFISVNFAIFISWINFFKGKRQTFWEPSKR